MKKKTLHQLQKLEETYQLNSYPHISTQKSLAQSTGLTQVQVSSWFSGRRRKDDQKRIKLNGNRFQESTEDDDSDRGSGSDGKSDSSHSNESLETANTLGQIASQKPRPQTVTPTESAPHVESLPVEIEENLQTANGGRDRGSQSKSCFPSSSKLDSSQRKEPVVDPVAGGGVDGDEGEIKSKMISILVEKNKRDKAKCQSLLDEITFLEKTIDDRDKLIDDLKKVR